MRIEIGMFREIGAAGWGVPIGAGRYAEKLGALSFVNKLAGNGLSGSGFNGSLTTYRGGVGRSI